MKERAGGGRGTGTINREIIIKRVDSHIICKSAKYCYGRPIAAITAAAFVHLPGNQNNAAVPLKRPDNAKIIAHTPTMSAPFGRSKSISTASE